MSEYDKDDGYKHCPNCNRLTLEQYGICLLCKGEIKPKRKRSRRDPFGAKRNHSRGHGWKANHES